jgi:hypothetical protein
MKLVMGGRGEFEVRETLVEEWVKLGLEMDYWLKMG